MLSKEKETKTDFLNNFYITPNNYPKKKSETNRDKKRLNQKTNPNFQKITGSANINTLGSQSIVVFKKTSNKKNIIDLNYNSKNNQNQNAGYISDGGLSQKLQKFNNNTNMNANNNINNIYFNNYVNDKNQPIPNNKNFKNNNIYEQSSNTNCNTRKFKEQQFSKTVRDFNKRPAIPKNEKVKDENTNAKNSKKLKNKSVNQNINSNPGNFANNKNNKHIKKINIEDSKNQEEKKILVMNKLVEAGVVSEILKLNKKKKITQKDMKDIRKREDLENNGLPIDFSGDEEEKKDDSKSNENNANNKEEKEKEKEKENSKNQEHNNNTNNMGKKLMSKTTRGFYPKMNNYMFSLDDNNNEEKTSLRAKKLKPSVNQFEYINRINNEKRKLNFNSELSPHRVAGLPKRPTKSVNMELNDSFRRKTSRENNDNKDNKNAKIKNKSYNHEIKTKSIEDYEDEFPFAHRKNQRSTEEIKKFVRQKRIKSKKEEDYKVFEKNKKLFLLFKNLYNLNMKDFTKPTPTVTNDHFFMRSPHLQSSTTTSVRGKAVIPSKNNINNNNNINKNDNNINNNTNGSSNSNSNSNLRKKKEINQYYIGNDSTIKNNNSTLIDPNEYYLNVLESQQLFVNSGLNKIENDLDTSEENDNNNNSNELNVSKEQIQKIIRTNSSDKKNNLVLDTNEYDDLKKKIGNTLKRAGKMFSNKDKDKENDTTEDNKTKSEISKSTEKKKDKEKEKENESSNKKNHPKSPEINIESSNVEQQKIINSETGNVTKEKNLPSLSHEYTTNSNPNKKIEIVIEPRAVLNFVEIIKFIIQRKVFVLLYESYINKAIYQQYNIAFAYFVAVCKHYPFRKLEEYCNYKTYKYAFRHLFKPFMRRALRKFIKNIYTKKKIEFLTLFLSKFYKLKILSKISNFAKNRKKIKDDTQKIKPFVSLITKPYLKSSFNELKNKTKQPKIEKLENKLKSNEKKIEDDILNNKINNHIEVKENIKDNNHDEIKEDIKDDDDNNNNNKIEDHFNKIENPKKIENRNDEDSVNLDDSIRNHRRKNDNSLKMNSYLYESFGSDSKSISLEPNSEDNDKLHQLKMMLLIKNNLEYEEENSRDMLDSNSNSLNNSASQKKYLNKKLINQQINAKISISDDEELKPDTRKDRIMLDKIKMDDLNKEKSIEIDISADNDKNNEIEWGYNINSLNSQQGDKPANDNKENNKLVKNEKSLGNEDFDNDEYNDFENEVNSENEDKVKIKTKKDMENEEVNIEEPKEEVKDNIKEKEDIKEDVKEDAKEEKNDIDIIKSDTKQDKSRNLKQDENQDIKILSEIKKTDTDKDSKDKKEKDNKEKEKDKEKENERLKELLSKKMKEVENPEKFADELVKDVLEKLLTTEIKSSKKKLVPTKKFKFDKFEKMNSLNNSLNNSYGSAGNSHDHLSKEFGISGLSQLSLADELLSLNDSIMTNYSAYSVFNKTIKDKKKEQTLNLYFQVIAPKLIKLIRREIIDKYPLIYENISTPMKNNSEKLMMSLALQDAELLRDNYKTTKNLVSISKILDKDKILKTFEPINKKIRSRDNLTSDNFYDKMLNDCIIETAIEIINKERLYGKNGEPLKWSSRTHELAFKYKKDDPKKLADFVCKKLYFGLHKKVGLISDNFETMTPEQINFERDKRLTSIIKRDLDEYEYQWNNLEMEETQLKVDNAELIMDQLYNEVIEILEHIQYSRIRPDLYQNKSIYACDEIPKLDFQLTTTEEATVPEGNENNDIINV